MGHTHPTPSLEWHSQKSECPCRAKGPQPLSCPPIQDESPDVLGAPACRIISAIKPHVLLMVRRKAMAP